MSGPRQGLGTGTDDEFTPVAVHRHPAAKPGRRDEAADLATCEQILAEGSKSFAAASRLLPRYMRAPATAFYAFCRVADDQVDFSSDPTAAVAELRQRLDSMYAKTPDDDPVDRAFCRIVHRYGIPRAVVDALIDGFEWDADGRTYDSLDDVLAYCARVASAVGVVMTLFMGPRDPRTLARACDLGAAMQLTNICRDVAEDARRGRLYLPADWLRERDIDPGHYVAHYRDYAGDPRISAVVEAVLDRADDYYRRADAGIGMLPRECRPAIRSASLIYADIGRLIRRQGCDPTRGRAHTSKGRKLWLLLRAWIHRTPAASDDDRDAPVIGPCAFLIDV